MRVIKRYGFKPGHRDTRDRVWFLPEHLATPAQLPPSVDLRTDGFEPPIFDQGDLGSCVWNAIAGVFQAECAKQGLPTFTPSRLFGYYNTRVIEGDISQDNGCEVRDAMKALANSGICPEIEWPYDVGRFAVRPNPQCFADGLRNLAKEYLSLPVDLPTLKASLAAGLRFVGGISVYDSFESDTVAQTGIVPYPTSQDSLIGGHGVRFVGYDDNYTFPDQRKGCFIVANSWGAGWGDHGYFRLSYDYLMNLGSDFWNLKLVS